MAETKTSNFDVMGLGASLILETYNVISDLVGEGDTKAKIRKICDRTGLFVEDKKKDKKEYPEFVRQDWDKGNPVYFYKLPIGMTATDFANKREYFNDGLKAFCIFKRTETELEAHVSITVLKGKLWERINYDNEHEKMKKYISRHKEENLDSIWIPIGYSRQGLEKINLACDSSPHVLIGGTTGSGKSTCLRFILTNLILTADPNKVEILPLDMKEGVEFALFTNTKFVKEKAESPSEANDFLKYILQITAKKYQKIKSVGLNDIGEYNSFCRLNGIDDELKYTICPIDELSLLDDDGRKLFEMLVATGRAAGTYVIAATQRPDTKVLSGSAKANMPVTVAFRTTNKVSSRVLMEDDSNICSYIDVVGRAFLKGYKETIPIQVPLLSAQKARELLQPYISETTMDNQKMKVIKRAN